MELGLKQNFDIPHQIEHIKEIISPYFDEEHYMHFHKQEVYKSKMTPLEHYVTTGEGKGYHPTKWFQTDLYQKYFPSHENPFSDWISQPMGTTDEKREQELIVSLTTWKPRKDHAWLAIESLLRQETKPNRLILWLDHDSFPDEKIPESLEILKKRGLEIEFSENLRCYTKLIPALKKYPKATIVTFDDDTIISPSHITSLYQNFKNNPKVISIGGGIKLNFNPQTQELYSSFNKCDFSFNVKNPLSHHEETFLLTVEGCNGCLYPPHVFSEEIFNKDGYALSKTNDDVFFSAMAILNDTKIEKVKLKQMLRFVDEIYQTENSLLTENSFFNSWQFSYDLFNVFSHYKLFEKLTGRPGNFQQTINDTLGCFPYKTVEHKLKEIPLAQYLSEYDKLMSLKISPYLYTWFGRFNSVEDLPYLKRAEKAKKIVKNQHIPITYDPVVPRTIQKINAAFPFQSLCYFVGNYAKHDDLNYWRILWTASEPYQWGMEKEEEEEVAPFYDVVLTNNKELAEKHPHCHFIPGYVATFTSGFSPLPPQKFGVSFLFSQPNKKFLEKKSNTNTLLYSEREKVWEKQEEIKIPKDFYVSNNPDRNGEKKGTVYPFPNKDGLFQTQFSIVIENTRQKDYFTEKVIDALLRKSIPIYMGCPNIAEYFDEKGLFIAKDVDDIINICNSLTVETYQKMWSYVTANSLQAVKLLQHYECSKIIFEDFVKMYKA